MEHISLLDSIAAVQNVFLKVHELGLETATMGLVKILNENPEDLRKIGIADDRRMKVPSPLTIQKDKQAQERERNRTF
jgi:hypothetical protein